MTCGCLAIRNAFSINCSLPLFRSFLRNRFAWRTGSMGQGAFLKRPSLGGDDSQRAAESELVFLELVCKSCLMLAGPHHLSRLVLYFSPLSWPNRSFHPNHYSPILASLGGDEVGIQAQNLEMDGLVGLDGKCPRFWPVSNQFG